MTPFRAIGIAATATILGHRTPEAWAAAKRARASSLAAFERDVEQMQRLAAEASGKPRRPRLSARAIYAARARGGAA
jgi:hypothetical protein